MVDNSFLPKGPSVSPGAPNYRPRGDLGGAMLRLIDRVEALLVAAPRIPWTNRSLVDRLELLDLVDQLRVAVPDEVQEARDILREREELLAHAREEVDRATARARQEFESRITESEIVAAARERADQMLAAAMQEAAERQREADAYALGVLEQLAEQLAGNLTTVRGGIRALQEELQLSRSRPPGERAREDA
ncbi:MAG: hypothetical protein HY689_00495 [Chloroflexi bacterium]|nr:hypothetical protein [Chloroflexota bacterium]